MLQNGPFYHQLTRKAVILFGRLFDDIYLVRKNNQTGKETQRFLVPIIYAPKEKMVTRVLSDPDLLRQVQTILPRMSFEITGISYDSARKQNSMLKSAKANTATRASSMYMGVPYDITFSLNIYARNIDDGTQIVEQILPFFNPDFTVTTNMIPDLGFLKDVPVILNSVGNDITYEGNYDSVRYVNWTLTFTMKTYYYGPISYPKIIRTVYANLWNDENLKSAYITRLNVANANGVFKADDFVYQGPSYRDATAYGIVINYSANTGRLVLGATQGQFKVNNTIRAVSTNGVCQIQSFELTPQLFAEIKIEPDPITAEPGDDYGYDITITETTYDNVSYDIVYSSDSLTISSDNMTVSSDNIE
jgi:hypothetical protein